ncbi:MAG TPA: hypothetical protein VN622_05975 [Clostridia bacterium]|nr:hypothetical protein [Clostridia bacterium]
MTGRAMPAQHKFYGYKMTDDTGFAPCASGQYLSLACCMTSIRGRAPLGSWVAGFGGKQFGNGHLIYLMQVNEVMTFDQYFREKRFRDRLDNVYYKENGVYRQITSARAHRTAREQEHDVSVDRVLVASRFVYFGNRPIHVPQQFAPLVPHHRNYCVNDGEKTSEFAAWAFTHGSGCLSVPHQPLPPLPDALIHIQGVGLAH